MSRLGDISYIAIVDNINTGAYIKMIDALKPKTATRCFIAVDKFQASVDLDANFSHPAHNLALIIHGVQNAYTNDKNAAAQSIVRASIVDTFISNNFQNATESVNGVVTLYAIYNLQNFQDRWFEISLSDLNALRLSFLTASNNGNDVSVVFNVASQSRFQFNLLLKIKFE